MQSRKIYCGECNGQRLPAASQVLPERISLPFDILLLVHWHESLHRCTGIHAAVLCEEGAVETEHWNKSDETKEFGNAWGYLISALDADRDLLLFPGGDAVLVDSVEWANPSFGGAPDLACDTSGYANDSETISSHKGIVADRDGVKMNSKFRKYRIIVLEANWANGKIMYKQIMRYRAEKGLPPLRCLILKDGIVGAYWRFHEEGTNAVSTIEAISHAAEAAGANEWDVNVLLLLFRLQRTRVLENVGENEGKKPKAMAVEGMGVGCWKSVEGYNSGKSK